LITIDDVELIDEGSYMMIPSDLDPETDSDVIKILCISDTHNLQRKLTISRLPFADIIINAGDMTQIGSLEELRSYDLWIHDYLKAHRKATHSIVIAGNRDQTLHPHFYYGFGYKRRGTDSHKNREKQNTTKCMATISKHSIYLQDSMVTLFGLNFYGTPWSPTFGRSPWAFQGRADGNKLKKIWSKIPEDVDILITHFPPYLHGDHAIFEAETNYKQHVGNKDLLNRVKEINNIRFHVFAGIHEGHGVTKRNGLDTTFINSALTDRFYSYNVRKPIMFYIKGKR